MSSLSVAIGQSQRKGLAQLGWLYMVRCAAVTDISRALSLNLAYPKIYIWGIALLAPINRDKIITTVNGTNVYSAPWKCMVYMSYTASQSYPQSAFEGI